MQRWPSPTSIASNGWQINETWLIWKYKARNQVQETLLDLLQRLKFQRKERGKERKTVFFPFLKMALKLFLWDGLKNLLWRSFDRVLPCFVTNLLKTSKQKMIKCAQNHFGEVSMLVQYTYTKFIQSCQMNIFERTWVFNS